MTNNISSMLNSKLRFTGMASGLDTDTIIQQMMQVEKMKVDKVKQDRQLLEWKRDDYRFTTNLLRGFKDEFFEVLKPASNMRSANTYYAYKAQSSNSDIVTASGASQVSMMEHNIKVTQLAEAANISGMTEIVEGADASLSLSDTIETVISKLGGGITLAGEASDELIFTINDKEIKVQKDKKLSDLISAINNSDAGVKISYSSFLDKFDMVSKTTGAEAKIEIKDNSGFFDAIGFNKDRDATYVAKAYGQNAQFELDGKASTNSSNIFTIDGITYTLHGVQSAEDIAADKTVKITLTQDTDAIFNRIKAFIDKYNEFVEKISGKIDESRPKSGGKYGSYYLPLTDEQRDAMSEDEIEKWEENAKKGLLKNDGLLSSIAQNMRRVMGDVTEAGGLFSIGISTGNWREGAKLNIDEDKLKKAITDNPDRVMEIFVRQSEIAYHPDNTKEQRDQRYQESGVVERLFDILQDNIRTTRNADGKKGLLLEKAGIVGDLTEFKSSIVEEINDKDELIYNMTEKLYDKENALYIKFSALETALSRMNSQSAWLAQSFGSNQ